MGSSPPFTRASPGASTGKDKIFPTHSALDMRKVLDTMPCRDTRNVPCSTMPCAREEDAGGVMPHVCEESALVALYHRIL